MFVCTMDLINKITCCRSASLSAARATSTSCGRTWRPSYILNDSQPRALGVRNPLILYFLIVSTYGLSHIDGHLRVQCLLIVFDIAWSIMLCTLLFMQKSSLTKLPPVSFFRVALLDVARSWKKRLNLSSVTYSHSFVHKSLHTYFQAVFLPNYIHEDF